MGGLVVREGRGGYEMRDEELRWRRDKRGAGLRTCEIEEGRKRRGRGRLG